MRIYVASSWRNGRVTELVEAMRAVGHEVYDFREDDADGAAFNWSDIDPEWQKWDPETFRKNLLHPRADAGYQRDFFALQACEAVVLVMPCGRSAHLELGYAVGAGKLTAILLSDGEPELCYRMVDKICLNIQELDEFITAEERKRASLFKFEAAPITKKGPE